jgi:SAM-dependent methyltransferase
MIRGVVYQLIGGDPEPEAVRRLTFVPFLPDGDCAVLPGPVLPTGALREDEHWLLEATLRIPLETAGYRFQRAHPFAVDGDHYYVWLDGDRYRGWRPHATVDLVTGTAEEIAARLAAAGRPDQARAVRDAAQALRHQPEAAYYAGAVRLLEPAYLRGRTPQEGSGFGGDASRWRAHREIIVHGIDRSGSFLDLGCANGLLMESVREWAAERGFAIEPYGVDLAPGLVALARSRLPQWADRIEVGNAIDYRPTGGRRFTFAHALLDTVPPARHADLVRHALDALLEPGGRLLVSHYLRDRPVAAYLRALGFPVAGESRRRVDGRLSSTAWIDPPPAAAAASGG